MSAAGDEEIFTTWTRELVEIDAWVLYLCGELDASSAPAFLADTHNVLSRRRNIIMDVHLLSYTDSTGVAAMLSIRNAVEGSGRRLLFVGCHGLLNKMLDAMRLRAELVCCPDLDQAIELLKGS